MKTVLAWYLLVGLADAAFAQGRPTSRPAQPPRQTVEPEQFKPEDLCTLEGNVANLATGEPLRKAAIALRRMDGSSGMSGVSNNASSDAGGHWIISGVEPGKYMLTAERTGFVMSRYGAKTAMSAGANLTLEKSQKLKNLDFKLTPQSVVAGRVLDDEGDPLSSVTVNVLQARYLRGRKQWMPMNGASTNDLGEYRIFGLAPGRYQLSATPQGRLRMDGAAEAYATVYYPSALSIEGAAPLEFAAGTQLRGIDFRLIKTQAVKVRGRVNIGSGKSFRSVNLMLVPRSETVANYMDRNATRPVNPQGDFVFNNVMPGSYTIIASAYEDDKAYTARTNVEVGSSPIEGISLTPVPGAEIAGKIVIEGSPVEAKNMRVVLMPKNIMSMMGGGPSPQGGLAKQDNTFTLQNVQADVFDVRLANAPEGSYVKSVRAGDAEVLESGLDFSNGVTPVELTVVVSMGAGQVDGTVQNDKSEPATGAAVVLIPEGKRRENDTYYKQAATDQTGHFSLKGIPPGSYRLFAFDFVEFGAYQDPEWLKPFESKGEKITIQENAHESKQLTLVVTEAK